MTNLLTLFIFLARARSSTIGYCGAAVKNVTLACFFFFTFFLFSVFLSLTMALASPNASLRQEYACLGFQACCGDLDATCMMVTIFYRRRTPT